MATAAPGMPLRSYRVHRYVTAFCPRCHEEQPEAPLASVARLSGYLAQEEGRIWLVRGCPTHGRVVTLYEEHPEILRYLEEWTAPTRAHIPDRPGNFAPIPQAYLRGLPEMQTQHSCILLEDVTQGCNLRCPTCFADSSPQEAGFVPVGEVLASVDTRLGREGGRLDVVMVSGGEPTTHPAITSILDELGARPINRILLNTNGVRVARDDALLDWLGAHRDRVEVYLQYDGCRAATHRALRGGDLGALKEAAIDRLSAAGVFTTLTMTAALGVNDDELGAVVQRCLATPYVAGVSIQPMFGSGRSPGIDPMARLTHTGVLARLGEQTGGLVTWRDLTALPCSHPHCCSVGYLLRTDSGQWRSLVAIIGHEQLKAHLGMVSNRIADWQLAPQLREQVRQSLMGLLSNEASLAQPRVWGLLRDVCDNCDLGMTTLVRLAGEGLTGSHRKVRALMAERIKRITVKPFMDVDTMIEERLVQCCVHVGTRADDDLDQCAPFCAVQAWAPLGEQKLSRRAVVGELAPSMGPGGAALAESLLRAADLPVGAP
ncbi:MAG TPA: radical SAM protein [Candidatus Nanopelagicales bacterium]